MPESPAPIQVFCSDGTLGFVEGFLNNTLGVTGIMRRYTEPTEKLLVYVFVPAGQTDEAVAAALTRVAKDLNAGFLDWDDDAVAAYLRALLASRTDRI